MASPMFAVEDDISPDASASAAREDDLQVMQGEALALKIADWLDRLRSRGTVLAPEAVGGLSKNFIKEKLDDVFEILPQPLREDDSALRARVAYLISEDLKAAAASEDSPEADSDQPYHKRVWDAMTARAAAWQTRTKQRPYGDYFGRHQPAVLFQLLKRCADETVWENCVMGHSIDPESLHSMEEDWRHRRPGWYLIFMWDPELEVQDWYRVYVGQAGGGEQEKGTLEQRGNRHIMNFRSPKRTEMLYQVQRRFADEIDEERVMRLKLIKLGFADEVVLPDGDISLFLNLGEMFFALIFRSLQVWDLKKWLPADVVGNGSDLAATGLNVASPLKQGWPLDAKMAFGRLANHADPDVAAYARKILRRNIQKVYDDKFVNNITSLRARGTWDAGGITKDGDKDQVVRVRCTGKAAGSKVECGWERDDIKPRFVVRTGEYVCRVQPCERCPPTPGQVKEKRAMGARTFVPVDDAMPRISKESVSHRLNKHKKKVEWREFYSGLRAHAPPQR